MRRRVLLGLLPAFLLSPLAAGAATPAASDPLAILADREAAARIGRAYLATVGDTAADPASLRRQLAAVLSPAGREVMRARLADAIRADFAASRTRLVDGWLLSETECRLCALAARTA
ncbi:MAG: hypothetical protein U1E14_08745 [Geminicoccaceae bacterium]